MHINDMVGNIFLNIFVLQTKVDPLNCTIFGVYWKTFLYLYFVILKFIVTLIVKLNQFKFLAQEKLDCIVHKSLSLS